VTTLPLTVIVTAFLHCFAGLLVLVPVVIDPSTVDRNPQFRGDELLRCSRVAQQSKCGTFHEAVSEVLARIRSAADP
jgi:hypothetical protein